VISATLVWLVRRAGRDLPYSHFFSAFGVFIVGCGGTHFMRLVSEQHPGVRVVYMSGYAEGLPEMQLPPHSAFLQKPFRFATLLEQLKLVQRKA
jgi:hypothetical protein